MHRGSCLCGAVRFEVIFVAEKGDDYEINDDLPQNQR